MKISRAIPSIFALVVCWPVLAQGADAVRKQCTATEYDSFTRSVEESAYGWSVAIYSNDDEEGTAVAVVGAPWEDSSAGAAYVYYFDGSNWEFKSTLYASDWVINDYFGCSVAISGDTIVIGARSSDGVGFWSGAAYVFVKPWGGWPNGNMYETAKLTDYHTGANDQFGYSVSVSGNYAVIGAPYAVWEEGRAYVYKKPGGGWVDTTAATATLSAGADADPADHFGCSVGISDDTIVAGARYDDNDGAVNCKRGSAYVFQGSNSSWSKKAKLVAEMPVSHDEFGYSVSISGDTIAIGTYDEDNHETKRGFAYVFKEPAGGWDLVLSPLHEDARLTASDATMNDGFGKSVSVSGDVVIAGAWGDDDNGDRSGSAYAFKEPTAGWHDMTETAKLLASDGETGDRLGRAVAISGNIAVVGAYKADVESISHAGKAYAFHGFDDCQPNGTLDICDIADGASLDVSPRDGVPDECIPGVAFLIDSDPDHEVSLWRTANNFIRLTFSEEITAPSIGELLIRVMSNGGGFSASYSISTGYATDFRGEVVPNDDGAMCVLEVWENGSVLTHTDWIEVRNLGGWSGVANFHRHYPVMKGDVDANGDVLPTDFGPIFPKIPTFGSESDERADVDGNRDVLPTDFGPIFPQIPTFGADYPKPFGHLP